MLTRNQLYRVPMLVGSAVVAYLVYSFLSGTNPFTLTTANGQDLSGWLLAFVIAGALVVAVEFGRDVRKQQKIAAAEPTDHTDPNFWDKRS
jgi:hypothetical protein